MANTGNYDSHDWNKDITLAQEAHIDAFALNMAHGVPANDKSVEEAFKVAEKLAFQLFFSFDYVGNGSWPQSDVINMIQKYSSSSAHYRHQDRPLVSTFEGFEKSDDWTEIKKKTNCFFVPDWSSVSAEDALQVAGGVADGLFSWAAWPSGTGRMNTFTDASFMNSLKAAEKPYMMPVSPWFFTDMPEYGKNWSFHGGNLWNDRWIEIFFLDPEWVEIISWNDYGESHYIGPLNDKGFQLFDANKGSNNYARDMPHDGWRIQLPFAIDLYKKGTASVGQESLVIWYRTQSHCTGNITGIMDDDLRKNHVEGGNKVFFSALLASNASIKAIFGDVEKQASWSYKPDGGIGIYYGNSDIDPAHLEDTAVAIWRSDEEVMKVKGPSLNSSCDDSFVNFNAWVGAHSVKGDDSASPKTPLEDQVCVQGSGRAKFTELCEYTCGYGYCPLDTCYCTAMGAAKQKPQPTKQKGVPKNGDDSYTGLCSFACYYGFCPSSTCKSKGTASGPSPTSAACGGENGHGDSHSANCTSTSSSKESGGTSGLSAMNLSLMFWATTPMALWLLR